MRHYEIFQYPCENYARINESKKTGGVPAKRIGLERGKPSDIRIPLLKYLLIGKRHASITAIVGIGVDVGLAR
jgi:hypothetical protein